VTWTTTLIEQWMDNPKMVERDMKILNLLDEENEFVNPYTEINLFGESYKLRNKGVVLHHTDEELQDIIYNKTKPESIFNGKPYDYQVDMLKFIQSNRMSVLCTARQIGTTYTLATYVIHYLINNWEKSIMFVTKDVEGATIKILNSLKNCPYYRQPGLLEYDSFNKVNDQSGAAVVLLFENGCTIRIFDMSKLLVSPDLLVIDGIQTFGKDLYEGILPGITSRTGTKMILTGIPDREGKFAKVLEFANTSKQIEVRSWDYKVFWSEFVDVIKESISTEDWLMEYELLQPGTAEWRDRMLDTLL
jgi:hypothetical protein